MTNVYIIFFLFIILLIVSGPIFLHVGSKGKGDEEESELVEEPERIMASAIKFKLKSMPQCWQIMCAKRHPDVFNLMYEHGIEYDKPSHVQGFWTTKERFVNREDAVDIALAAGQLPPDFNETTLYSEDIWPV